MARITIKFNERFFDQILNSPQVQGLCKAKAAVALANAQARAPVKTGAYRDSLHLASKKHAHRTTWMVESDSDHALAVESRTGNLTRALKAVGR
jgi:hypothetical protein|nr:MAG TPA: hypothetical protein [Caudoviricetes sp.]